MAVGSICGVSNGGGSGLGKLRFVNMESELADLDKVIHVNKKNTLKHNVQ